MSDLNESHITLARLTDALFCSHLEVGDTPTGPEVAAAIRRALRKYRNWNGCTRVVAAAFANTPTEATEREAWCSALAEDVLGSMDVHLEVERWA